jgi:primosomal protein N''
MRPSFAKDNRARFTFWLAEKLGMTVSQLRREMSAREFRQWAAYYKVKNEEERRAREQAKAKAAVRKPRGRR